MEDLTHSQARYLGLAPSSMSGSNTISDDPALAMTAPGSQSVNPNVPERADVLPMPVLGEPKSYARIVRGEEG